MLIRYHYLSQIKKSELKIIRNDRRLKLQYFKLVKEKVEKTKINIDILFIWIYL